jgi:hypothetical protein
MGRTLRSFDEDRHRADERKAEELFNFLWPDRKIRMACVDRLARSILSADERGTASWVVSLFNWDVRLNVGQVLVLQFDSDAVLVYARSARGKSVYDAVRVPSRSFRRVLGKIGMISSKDWRDHDRFIKAAAEAKRNSPFKGSFSEGAVRYLESVLGTELPRPAYLNRSTTISSVRVERKSPPELVEMPRFGTEGHRRLASHLQIERNRSLVEEKKREVLKTTGGLACEVCSFDFRVYGELGEEFCEVHHLRPLSKNSAEVRTGLSDLAVVCANCHRMIHRGGRSRSLSKVRASLRSS